MMTEQRPCAKHRAYDVECAHCRAENCGPGVDPRPRRPPSNLPEFRIQVLRLRGELNLEDLLKVRNMIDEYLRAGLVNIVLDLANVSHIHLAGVPVLVAKAHQLRDYKGDLKLCNASSYIRHILGLAGAGEEFALKESQEAAVKAFQDREK
jgi:anti-anti-sigma factor